MVCGRCGAHAFRQIPPPLPPGLWAHLKRHDLAPSAVGAVEGLQASQATLGLGSDVLQRPYTGGGGGYLGRAFAKGRWGGGVRRVEQQVDVRHAFPDLSNTFEPSNPWTVCADGALTSCALAGH